MDSYKLDEIKMLIDKNLLNSDVLINILNSTKRRIELYDDEESVNILKYLSTSDIIPEQTKEDINKYLAEYNSSVIKDNEEEVINNKVINWRVVLIYSLIITLVIIIIGLFLIMRWLNVN